MKPNPFRDNLRAAMRARRACLTPAERADAAGRIADHLERLAGFSTERLVAGYWAVGGEASLHVAVSRLRARGQVYHVPVVDRGREMRFAPLPDDAKVRPNRYGIAEPVCAEEQFLAPAQMGLVLAPLLAFTRGGGRLGMGGGHYDASFAFLRGVARPARPLLVGIGYAFQQIDALDAQAHDVALDYVATERELIDCSRQAGSQT